MIWLLAAVCWLASLAAGVRWLRVAQREHYLAPATTRFALRWWGSGWVNRSLGVVAIAAVLGSALRPIVGLLAGLAQVGPVGLSLRGRTSALTWTPRLRRVAYLSGTLVTGLLVAGALLRSAPLVAVVPVVLPLIIDAALLALAPMERRLGEKWVEQASRRLASSEVEVVGITGSYGKTSTKGYAAHLLAGSKRVVASPASFNNRMGLARAINEQLVPGSEVFIAEMGTYGAGEITDLCRWLRPRVSAIVSVGPVHLERFRTEERIVEAKSEILQGAEVGVIGIDHPLLAELAVAKAGELRLITASARDAGADVAAIDGELWVEGERVARLPEAALGVNLAVAVGICLGLGLEPGAVIARLADLPGAEHRLTLRESERGFTIIDDTYNSNPAGVSIALDTLARVASDGGRRVVVTPGMVELGQRQVSENMAFAARASAEADDLIIVGGTNRAALREGSAKGTATVTVVATREAAVTWVRANLVPGDAVLYENDLPDHYP